MPTLQLRVRIGSPDVSTANWDASISERIQNGRLVLPINMPANHLNVGRLILSSCSIESRYKGNVPAGGVPAGGSTHLPKNTGFFFELPWLESGVVGQNENDGPHIADAIYMPQGSYTKVGNDWVTSNNESPSLEYNVINNQIPYQFYLYVYPVLLTGGARDINAVTDLRYLEANLYFSYM